MELKVVQSGDRVRFEIKGNVNESGAADLKHHFRQLNLSSIKEIVFDFSGVDHIGSAGIGKLLLIYKDFSVTGGKIRVEHVSGPIFDLFKLLKLDTIFNISKE